MTIFDILNLLGGLCLFLFGMNVMGEALERRAGSRLSVLIGKLTTNRFTSFLTGLGVTAIIQSSSATTVMAVGFVNSGVMTLRQSIGIIMGANIGTTVTAWILSLSGIESTNLVVQLLKPSSFTPILALIGVIFYLFCKSHKKKDTGAVLLGFAVLMFGMETMSGAVAGLRDVPQFREMFLMFRNPILGVLVGAVLTAIIQSSSASVGILQALTVTGQITYGAAIPIIMGQNIGTCVTAILSSFGANRNAKRVAFVHLSFNVIGTSVLLILLTVAKALFPMPILDGEATALGIAIAHTLFNAACTILLFPMSGWLEKLACWLVPDAKTKEAKIQLDDRLLSTPALALDSAQHCAVEMAKCVSTVLSDSTYLLTDYKSALAEEIRQLEDRTDQYESILGSYLVKLSSQHLNEEESATSARILRIIGDLERIADHGVNILESAEELQEKKISFTDDGIAEMNALIAAVKEIVGASVSGFITGDLSQIENVAPLEEVIDRMKDTLRAKHISRLQQGQCSIDAGFVWADLLTSLERISDHCCNIAGCLQEAHCQSTDGYCDPHGMRAESPNFAIKFAAYRKKYLEQL